MHGRITLLKCLDHVVADLAWKLEFPEACVEVLPRVSSYHNPLLLGCNGFPRVRVPRPFRFEAAWLSHQGSPLVVQKAWNRGSPDVISSLCWVRQDSIKFNKENFGDIFLRKRLLEARLAGVQRNLEICPSFSLEALQRKLQ